jgi:ribosomal protein S18 acetylase RimI-like enzyme
VSPGISTRPARKTDASDIALLVNIATHGGVVQSWANDIEAAGTYNPVELGRLRMLREDDAFNWRNVTMAEGDGEIAGMLLGYREPNKAAPLPADMPPSLAPIYELEAEAAGKWYISMLGVYGPWRGKGVGGKLLDVADAKCLETASSGLALITEDVNEGARRLYERRGFVVRSRRKMLRFPGGGPKGEDWLLMVKE